MLMKIVGSKIKKRNKKGPVNLKSGTDIKNLGGTVYMPCLTAGMNHRLAVTKVGMNT